MNRIETAKRILTLSSLSESLLFNDEDILFATRYAQEAVALDRNHAHALGCLQKAYIRSGLRDSTTIPNPDSCFWKTQPIRVTPLTFSSAISIATDGSTFILSPGIYDIAANGAKITTSLRLVGTDGVIFQCKDNPECIFDIDCLNRDSLVVMTNIMILEENHNDSHHGWSVGPGGQLQSCDMQSCDMLDQV